MAIYRNVQMSFWTDRKIDEEFSADEKYLYLFFLTNPMTNLCGCYEIGRKQIANMTGFDMKKVKSVMGKLQNDQQVILYSDDTGELLLVNWHKYNWTDSEKFRKPLLSEIESVKDDTFREYLLGVFKGMDTVSIPYPYGMDTVSIPYPYGMDTTVTDTVTDTDTVSVNKKGFGFLCLEMEDDIYIDGKNKEIPINKDNDLKQQNIQSDKEIDTIIKGRKDEGGGEETMIQLIETILSQK